MKPCYLCGKRTDDCAFDPPVCRECQRAHELTKEIAQAQLAVGTDSKGSFVEGARLAGWTGSRHTVAELNGGPATAKLMSLEEFERALESATFDESD